MKDRRTGGQSTGQSRRTAEIAIDDTATDTVHETLSAELRERIAVRAYDLAERRGGQNGRSWPSRGVPTTVTRETAR